MTETRAESRLPRVYYRTARRPSELLASAPIPPARGAPDPTLLAGLLADSQDAKHSETVAGGQFVALRGPVLPEPPAPPNGGLTIAEHEGAIRELVAVNSTKRIVLLERGTLLEGGAQDRAVADTVLLPPGRTTFSVFCVEQGRWEPTEREFRTSGVLPDLLALHAERAAAESGDDPTLLQRTLWDTIRDSLIGMEAASPTVNVSDWQRTSPASPAAIEPREDLRGGVLLDRTLGLASLHVIPGPDFASRLAVRAGHELAWRQTFAERVSHAREYFRIYDEQRRIGLRTTAAGVALRDLKGNYLLFEYDDEDLEGSFRPPLEGPPPLALARLEEVGNFATADAFLAAAAECHVSTVSESRQGRAVRLQHPERPIAGRGFVLPDQGLASLSVQALRAA